MATNTISDRHEHVRSIGVTAFAALLGVGTAFVSSFLTADAASFDAAARETTAYLIVFAVIALEVLVIKNSGLYTEDEFGIKHYLFLTFMTFSLWFVTWGILLTSQAGA
ncbi:hypothetical protein [Natrononativus amylolyticus]|uniref:EMC6-like membrane protein n=1 Tax=Natrononativus amylolyticus TaxID=2963434 RepID=UPI0020CCCFAE|nr:hypothetical protein [Natrononativus amylolyticus]